MDRSLASVAGLALRTTRIVSGLFLLFFVTSHLLNLSLGVISIEAMDAARPYLSTIWSRQPLASLLLLSLLVHFLLGLWAIYRRPTLRTNAQDVVQLLSGVAVIPLLAVHAVGVATLKIDGIPFGYAQAIKFFWLGAPQIGLLQVIMLSVVWVHGCAGLFTWLRAKEGMRNALAWIYPLAVAVPVIALMGYAEAGRGVLIAAQAPPVETPQYAAPAEKPAEAPSTPAKERIPYEVVKQITNQVIWWSLGLAALTFMARAIRLALQTSQKVILTRGSAPPLHTTSGLSLLDSFRAHQHPHASLCEGRGRCGTCAVRITLSEFPLPAPTALEAKTLLRIGADDTVRLACQLVPSGGAVTVEPLHPADYSFKDDDFAEELAAVDASEVRT
ncbi:(2Fe-2S)-binding protein [Roseobacter sp. YSTF-M11]|uniref:(2Fe-2S)-binding protein n=1 Tax=Roseobacter insulae TaxID=2859783 RepID=A0A9X1FWH9_9RHOB|nr:2Fe-2S iron-sulfur cluster-binding protein [Roseobacter insulae]MBW4708963.1 (2Fe-2S)-binding protein [Roseobacter insulae]